MKLLFVHDIKAKCFEGKIYARSYGIDVWSRYLSIFDSIKVCTRSFDAIEEEVKGIDLLNCENVEFDRRVGMFKGPEVFFSCRIKKILRKDIFEADAVILRLDSFLGLMASWECRRQGKPYLIEVVGCAWDSFWNHGLEGKIIALPIFLIMKNAIKKAPFVVYVTKFFLQERYPTTGKSTNISNVSIQTHDDIVLRKRLKKIEELHDGDTIHLFTVANVGVRYKGMHLVVEALSLLKRKGIKNFVYHMVGEGDQSYIRSVADRCGVSDQIAFHGAVSHGEVIELLQSDADLYIQPSLQEGLPRSVIEAMSVGLPCIGSDVAGIPELIDASYMFFRKKDIPTQISMLILKMDKDQMLEQSALNFKKAQEYESDILNKRRVDFLLQFKKYVKQRNI